MNRRYDAVYPALESAASLLTTRATETLQQLPDSCKNSAQARCAYMNKSSTSYYVGDVEFFTVSRACATVASVGGARMTAVLMLPAGGGRDSCLWTTR